MNNSINQTQRCWEQRLGELIQKTSTNLRKLQASCDVDLIGCPTTIVNELRDAPTVQKEAYIACKPTPQGNGELDNMNSRTNTFQNTNGEVPLPLPPPAEKGKNYPMAVSAAKSTRTLLICKQAEEAMIRRMEQTMRRYLDHIVEDRITIKLGEALNECDGITRKMDENEITAIRDKCQSISNGILRLTKEIRMTKSELDALTKAKHDILLQQKESDDRNALFTENLQRQIESIALANEKYRQKLIEHLKTTNVTLSTIPAIENDVKKLQETCVKNQNQVTTLQTRFDWIAEEVLKNQKQNSLFKSEALACMTNFLTPICSNIQEEIRAIKNCVIEATANETRGIIDPEKFEAVIEPFVAKEISEINKSLVTDLRNCAMQHGEKESKKLRALFKDLKRNLRNSLGSRFYEFSEKITLLQQEELVSRMQQYKNDLETRCETFIENQLIDKIRAKLRECDAQQSKSQSTILSPQKDKSDPIINSIDIMEEWINSIVSNAVLPFTLKSTENCSTSAKQTLDFEDHHTRDKSIFSLKDRHSEVGEKCVRSIYENSGKQSQTEQRNSSVVNSIHPHPADCDLEIIKEQLRKEVIEQASVAFESRLQRHFVEFDKLIGEKIEMLFASYNTELTRVKVDAEAIYRFHRAIEKDLDNKLSFLQQKWSEELRQFKLELASLSASCDQGKTQQQCLQTAFNSVSDLTLKFQEKVDDALAQISCLKEQNEGQKDLNWVGHVNQEPCCQGRTDSFHEVIFSGGIPQQTSLTEYNKSYKENVYHQNGSEYLTASLVLDKMDSESKAEHHSLSSEEYSRDEAKTKDKQLAEIKCVTIPHLLSIPFPTSVNLSEKNDCTHHSPQSEVRNKDLEEESDNERESSLLHRKPHFQNDEIPYHQVSSPRFAVSTLNSFQENHIQYSTESLNVANTSKVEWHSSEISPLSESNKDLCSTALVPTAASVCSFLIQHELLKDDEDASATSTLAGSKPHLVNLELANIVESQVDADKTQQRLVHMNHHQHAENNTIVYSRDQNLSISDAVSECIEVADASDGSSEGSEVQCYSFSFESSTLR